MAESPTPCTSHPRPLTLPFTRPAAASPPPPRAPPHPPPRPLPLPHAPAELKQALAAAGIASEFHAGALYCAGHVVVKRRQPQPQPGSGAGSGGGGEEGGGLVVEGALSEDYYRIREVVYSQYHIC